MAWDLKNGTWRLTFIRPSETYAKKEIIKASGGLWDGSFWTVPESAIKKVGAQKMVQAIADAHCHTPEETIWVTESELAAGEKQLGCGFCDTIEICGKMVKLRPIGETP